MNFLGIDIGTSGCKAVVFREDWTIAANSYREYDFSFLGANYLELDPETVWLKTRAAIVEVNEQLGPGHKVGAMAVSAVGDIIIPQGPDGRPVRDSIVDFDARGATEIKQFSEEFGVKRLFQLTGMPPLFINSLSKMLWLKHNEPDSFKRVRRWATFEDFFLEKLGLTPVVSHSLAARTMLFDIREKKWADEVLSAAGFHKENLPQVQASGSLIGTLPRKTARELGFSAEVTVFSGAHDMVCAAVASGLTSEDPATAVDITGTIEGLVVVMQQPNTNDTMLHNLYPCYPGYRSYVSFSVNLTAGCILRWYRDVLAEKLYQQNEAFGQDVYDLILKDLDVQRPGSLLLVPNFSGSGNPYFDAKAKGFIYGLTLDTRREDLVQGIIEGLCYSLRAQLDEFEAAQTHIRRLRAVGGGAKSDKWLQLKSNILKKEIIAMGAPEASALGAALMAGAGAGAISDPALVALRAGESMRVFTPSLERSSEFEEGFRRYRALAKQIHHFEQNFY